MLAVNPDQGTAVWQPPPPPPGSTAPPPPPASSAPAPPPPPAPTSSIDFGGYKPDYQALIASDPTLTKGLADITAYQSQLLGSKSDAIKRAVVAAGFAPPGATGDIDQATLDAAGQNQFSTKAQLDLARKRGSSDLAARLAARGVLNSGALTGGEQRVQQGYEQGTQSAMQQLLAAITGYQGDYNNQSFQLALQKAGLSESAASRIAQDPRYRPTDATHAVLDRASGLYKTSDGRWYTVNGDPQDAPGAYTGAASPPTANVSDPAIQAALQASIAANPQAAGAGGSAFTYTGDPSVWNALNF